LARPRIDATHPRRAPGTVISESIGALSVEKVHAFLAERFLAVRNVTEIQSGAWSNAFAFDAQERELILRIGAHREDFEKERVAATWNSADVPIPEVLDLGDAFDGYYIVSQRHYGTKLADLHPSRVPRVMSSLIEVVSAMRQVPLPGKGFGIWLAPNCDAPSPTWADYLCSVVDRDESRLVAWRAKLATHPRAHDAFQRGTVALQESADLLPNTRSLVHADLLLNHLVNDNDGIAIVFDWANALAGDPTYDIAWILFCIPWFPMVNRQHVLQLAEMHFPHENLERLLNIYELHIGVASLQYLAYAEDLAGLETSTHRIEQILQTPI
jgi:hygromycin-B 4-O-kinase